MVLYKKPAPKPLKPFLFRVIPVLWCNFKFYFKVKGDLFVVIIYLNSCPQTLDIVIYEKCERSLKQELHKT